uniref:Glycoside hydrolase n=1 Tax=viral metagenome TaxID=1070528 RepID=A0A6M3LYE1_9ZZZZ
MKRLNVLVTNWRAAGGVPWVAWIARTLDAAVWIKAYDGGRWLDLGAPFAQIAHELQSAGVDVGAWGFHYGAAVEVDLLEKCYTYRHAQEDYKGPRAGLLIDAEREFESGQGKNNAEYQVDRILDAEIPVPVYYTSFAFPEVHPRFPYAEFNRLSGGHVPQCYFNHEGWPDPFSSVMRCVGQHHARGIKLAGAMLPVYDAGSEQGWRPTRQELEQATLAMCMWNVPGAWTWSWEYHSWADWTFLWHYSHLLRSLT